MSVSHALHLVDAAAFERWVALAASEGPDACIERALAEARTHASSEVRQWVDDQLDDAGEPNVQDLSDGLMLLLEKRQWSLGNLLGTDAQQLQGALALVPDLEDLEQALRRSPRDLGRLGKIACGLEVVADSATP